MSWSALWFKAEVHDGVIVPGCLPSAKSRYWLYWLPLSRIVFRRGTCAAFRGPDGPCSRLSATRWMGEAEPAPLVFSAGSLILIAVDCSSKGRAICQRCHKKGGSKWERSRTFSHTHTHTHTHRAHSHCRLCYFAETSWAPIGRSVPMKCDSKSLFGEWQTGREAPRNEARVGARSSQRFAVTLCWTLAMTSN